MQCLLSLWMALAVIQSLFLHLVHNLILNTTIDLVSTVSALALPALAPAIAFF